MDNYEIIAVSFNFDTVLYKGVQTVANRLHLCVLVVESAKP